MLGSFFILSNSFAFRAHHYQFDDVGCTRTQGYWGYSPIGKIQLIKLVGTRGMNLGNKTYTSFQIAQILKAPPVGGNALVSLAHQLISTKLNVLAGADSSEISREFKSADSLIADYSIGKDFVSNDSEVGREMNIIKDRLDDYNNGLLNVPHCN